MTRDIDWGIPVPLDGLARQPDQAALRVVRRGRRLPLGVHRVGPPHRRPRALARVVERPRGASPTTSGQGQHHLPLARSGRPSCSATRVRAASGGEPGELRRAQPADRGRGVASSSRWRASSSRPPAATSILVRDVLERYGPDGIRYFICAAGPENQDANFTWRDVRAAQQLRARRRAGATSSTATATMIAQELRRDPGGRAARGRRRGAARHGARRVRRPSVACSSGTAPEGRDRRGDARRRRGQRLRLAAPSRSSSRATTSASGSARCCTRLVQASSDLNTMLSPFLPHAANRVDAVLGGDGRSRADAAARDGRRPRRRRRAPLLPRHHRRLLGDAAVGVAPGRGRDADQQAGPGLPQARRVGGRRGARPGGGGLTPVSSQPSRRDERPPAARPAADPGRRQPHPPRHQPARARTSRSTTATPVRARRPPWGSTAARPGRLRPGRRPVHRRGGRAVCGAARRCRRAPQRGAPARGRPGRSTTRLRRDRAARDAPAGPGGRGDRARLLPHRPGRGPVAAGLVPLAHRPRQAARTAPCRSTTATPRRRAADPRRGGGAAAYRAALLLRRRADGARVRRARLPTSRSRARSRSRTRQALRDALAVTPLELLLVETDAPYLDAAPVARGATNASVPGPAHGAGDGGGAHGRRPHAVHRALGDNSERVYGPGSLRRTDRCRTSRHGVSTGCRVCHSPPREPVTEI